MDDKLEDPRLEKLDGDGAARAAGADEQSPRALRLSSMVLLCFYEGESVRNSQYLMSLERRRSRAWMPCQYSGTV